MVSERCVDAVSAHASSSDGEYGEPGHRFAVLVLALLVTVLALVVPWLVPAVPRFLAAGLPEAPSQGQVVRDPEVLAPDAPGYVDRATTAAPPGLRSLVGVRVAAAGIPVGVTVDRLSIRSDVVAISGNTGVLLPPGDPRMLGWWREGAVPGAQHGTAVLTGHTVHTGGGAFDHLRLLVPGDRLRVRTERGSIRYAVATVKIFSVAALAAHSREIFRLGGPGRLVLITCSDWNGKIYLTNTVVVAKPVAPASDGAGPRASGWRAPL